MITFLTSLLIFGIVYFIGSIVLLVMMFFAKLPDGEYIFRLVPLRKKIVLSLIYPLYLYSSRFRYWALNDIDPSITYEKFREIDV